MAFQHLCRIYCACNSQTLSRSADGYVVLHQMQFLILWTLIIQPTGQQIKGRSNTQLIKEGVLTIISLAYLDGVIAHTSTDAKDTESSQAEGYNYTRQHCSLCLRGLVCLRYPQVEPSAQ